MLSLTNKRPRLTSQIIDSMRIIIEIIKLVKNAQIVQQLVNVMLKNRFLEAERLSLAIDEWSSISSSRFNSTLSFVATTAADSSNLGILVTFVGATLALAITRLVWTSPWSFLNLVPRI